MTENAKDKEKFIEESSSDSLYPAQKFEAIEEISNDGNSDVDTWSDVSMLPSPECATKVRAQENIAEIVDAGKRHRKPVVPPQAPAIQVENFDLQQTERHSACGDDLISFEEDPCDSTPASANAQSSVENNNSQPNAVPESILDSNNQEYVGRSFPKIVQEIFDKLSIDLRKNPVSNRCELQKGIWEKGSDKENSQKVCEKAPKRGTSISIMSISQDIGQSNDNNYIIPAKNFDTLVDERESWNKPRTKSSKHCDAKIVEQPEKYRCAETMPSVPLPIPTHNSIPQEARYYNSDNTSTRVESSITHLPDNQSPSREIADARDHNTSVRDTGSSVLQNADVTHVAEETKNAQQCHDNAALYKYFVAKSRPPSR